MIVLSKIDLGRILEVQKKAFEKEAIKHNDLSMAPMTQTIAQITEEFDNGTIFFKYEENGIIVGSVRALLNKDLCKIGRLIVDPNFQNKGVGKTLMLELENYFSDKCSVFRIFTGEKSDHALALYTKFGYKIIGYTNVGEYALINMEKENKRKTIR